MGYSRRQFLQSVAGLAGYEMLRALRLTPPLPRAESQGPAVARTVAHYRLPVPIPHDWRQWATQPAIDAKTGLATFRWNENWAPIYPPDLPSLANLSSLMPQDLVSAAKYLGPDRGERYTEVIQGQTKCNVFMLDWAQALGRELPRYGLATDGQTVKMNTSLLHAWLQSEGGRYGWQAAESATEAQAAANRGRPVIAIFSVGMSGHIAAVMPTSTGEFHGITYNGVYYPPVASAAATFNSGFTSALLAFEKWIVKGFHITYFTNTSAQPYSFVYGDETYSWPPTDFRPLTGLEGLDLSLPLLDQRDCPLEGANAWDALVHPLQIVRGQTAVAFGLHVDLASDEVYGKGAGPNGESLLQINSALAAQRFGRMVMRPGDQLSFTDRIGFWTTPEATASVQTDGKGACYAATVFTELFGLRIKMPSGGLMPLFQTPPNAVQAHGHQIARYHGWGTAVNGLAEGKLPFRVNPQLPPGVTLTLDMSTCMTDPANPLRGVYTPIVRAVISGLPPAVQTLEVQRLTANRDGILQMITASF